MSKYTDLYEEWLAKVKDLQDNCKHEKLTDWTEEFWAMGHTTGRNVQYCEECQKIINVNVRCSVCQKLLLNDEAKVVSWEDLIGPLKVQTHYGETPYCSECILKPDPRLVKIEV